MDLETIADMIEVQADGLRELACRFLEPEAGDLGMPLDEASVLAWRAEGTPEVHITRAADEFVRHLAAQPDALTRLG